MEFLLGLDLRTERFHASLDKNMSHFFRKLFGLFGFLLGATEENPAS